MCSPANGRCWRYGIWDSGRSGLPSCERLLPGISEKVLTAQLRELESDGIVGRQVKRASPPQVTYSLTSAGEELIEPMSVLCKWGTEHLGIPPNLPRYPQTQNGRR